MKQLLLILLLVIINTFIYSHQSIHKIDIQNEVIYRNPVSITADSQSFYILDQKACKIHKIDKNGNTIVSFGNKGQGPGEMLQPWGIFAKDKYIYALDKKGVILKYKNNGDFISSQRLEKLPNGMINNFAVNKDFLVVTKIPFSIKDTKDINTLYLFKNNKPIKKSLSAIDHKNRILNLMLNKFFITPNTDASYIIYNRSLPYVYKVSVEDINLNIEKIDLKKMLPSATVPERILKQSPQMKNLSKPSDAFRQYLNHIATNKKYIFLTKPSWNDEYEQIAAEKFIYVLNKKFELLKALDTGTPLKIFAVIDNVIAGVDLEHNLCLYKLK